MMETLQIPSLSGKKVLITGGCGFLGSSLAKRLVSDADVTLFVRPGKDRTNIQSFEDKLEIIEGDVTNEDDVKKAVNGKDYIFHFAWQTDLKQSMKQPKEDVQTDILGLLNILEACKENKEVKLIFASTVTVIGQSDNLPSNEQESENPTSVYDINKLMAEKLLRVYYDNYGLQSCVLRLSNIYGEGQRTDNPNRGVLNFMIGRALRGEVLNIYGEGDFVRDYCYVENYVDAFILAAASEKTSGEVFVMGSGEGRTFVDVIKKVKLFTEEIAGRKVTVTHVPFPEGNTINKRNFYADYTKFHKATGWKPQVKFEEGLRKTIEYFSRQ